MFIGEEPKAGWRGVSNISQVRVSTGLLLQCTTPIPPYTETALLGTMA